MMDKMRAQADQVKASPWFPETDPVRVAVLGKLGEESGELTSATSRCVIQGLNEREPVTGEINREWLQNEIGDVLAGIEVACDELVLDRVAIETRRLAKVAHLQQWHMLIRLGDKGIDRRSMPRLSEIKVDEIMPTFVKVQPCGHRYIRPTSFDGRTPVATCVECGGEINGLEMTVSFK